MQNRFLIVHGTKGSPNGNWFPWLKNELEKQEDQVITPSFPTPERQNFNSWKEKFHEEFGELTANSILVGHSIGATFVLRLLEESSIKIKGIYLVAPLAGKIEIEEFDLLNGSFFTNFNWQKIKANTSIIRIIFGSNDQYVPIEQSLYIAKQLDVEPIIIEGGKHLNSENGYDSFPYLRDLMSQDLSILSLHDK